MTSGFAEALGSFAESTRDAITSMGNALEAQDASLQMLTGMAGSFAEWAAAVQDALLSSSARIDELEGRVEELEKARG